MLNSLLYTASIKLFNIKRIWLLQSQLTQSQQTSDLIEISGGGDEIKEKKSYKIINRPRKLEGIKAIMMKSSQCQKTFGDPFVSHLTPIPSFLLLNKTPNVFKDPPSSSRDSDPIPRLDMGLIGLNES